jgi:hypothetical protein
MHTGCDASLRYSAPRSPSENTQAVSIPISRQVRITRRAISPRLATRIRLNFKGPAAAGPDWDFAMEAPAYPR